MNVDKRRESSHLYEFGAFRLDPFERVFSCRGERIPLAPKAFDTLVVLVQHRGHVLTKEELIGTVWPDAIVEENNLTQQISQLRRALGEASEPSAYIETVPKLGYRFVSEVREISPDAAEGTVSKSTNTRIFVREEREEEEEWQDEPAPAISIPNGHVEISTGTIPTLEAHPLEGRQTRRTATLLLALALTVLLAIGAAVYLIRGSGRDKPIDSVAVLPFLNVSNDPNTEYLSDGITESLITILSQLSNLRVMARGTVFSYTGQQVDPRKAGRDLKVGAVVTGRITERGDSLIVEVDLVNVADGRELWGERYDRKLPDLLEVQDEITTEISRNLRLRLSGDDEKRLHKVSTSNPEAYRLYLKGRYFASKATQEDLAKGIGYLNQAIAIDPKYALAYDGISYYYVWTNDLLLAPRDAMPKAKQAARKALELDEQLPQAHVDLANVLAWYDWDWAAAEREYQRALQLDPNSASAHAYLGYLLVSESRTEEGIQESKRAVDLDPVSPEMNWWMGWMLYLTHQYDAAGEQLRKTIELDPNYFLAYLVLGGSYAQNGRMAQAIPELEKAVSLGECNQSLGELGRAYALSGQRQKAQAIADRLIADWKRSNVGAYDIAIIEVGLGDKDRALAWLDKAYEDRSFFLLNLKNEPELDPLRSDPRFEDLLRRMNFPR